MSISSFTDIPAEKTRCLHGREKKRIALYTNFAIDFIKYCHGHLS